MLKFCETEARKNIDCVLGLRKQVEEIVDAICEKGYENLFLLGIGGTYAASMEIECYMRGHSSIPVYLENAADLTVHGNSRLTPASLVLTTSATGNTQELVDAVEFVHKKGASVFGFIDDKDAPLAKMSDYVISAPGGSYFKMLLAALRLMKNAGEFPDYEEFFIQLDKSLADDMIEVEKAADEKAAEYAGKHCDDELQYVTGAGNLWGAAYSFAMCYMEEMLWMRTKSISAAEFFHGTLEVIDRDSNLLIFMGEDDARKQTDRVYAFAQRICANIAVFDTKDYAMEGIEEKFRGLLSPIIMGAVFNRITAHLEEERKHPLEIRRYYRRLKY